MASINLTYTIHHISVKSDAAGVLLNAQMVMVESSGSGRPAGILSPSLRSQSERWQSKYIRECLAKTWKLRSECKLQPC